MNDALDSKLLEFALKKKHFVAELANQTRAEYYAPEIRGAMNVVFAYYKSYNDIPSYDVLCKDVQSSQIKDVLKQAYDANKEMLVDGDFPYLLSKIKEQYNNTLLIERVGKIHQGLNDERPVEKLNEELKKLVVEVSSITSNQIRDQGTLQESAQQRLIKYKHIKENPDASRGVLSGFKELDALTNGFKGSELILVSGPTGSGKSLIVMNMALNAWMGSNKIELPEDAWKNDGKNVWFITIENPRNLLERRIDSCLAGVSCNHIRDGQLDEGEEVLFRKSLKFQHSYGALKRFHISDLGRGVNMAIIEAEYDKLLMSFKPDLIVIDYLGIMRANNPTGSDWLDQGMVAAEMYEFCRSIKDAPIITASQMKSAIRTQSGLKRFTGDPESVARSKMITDNVNMNLQIRKDETFNVSSYLELHVAKNRDGETGGVIVLSKEFWRQRVSDPLEADFIKPGLREPYE
jgi:replicative DNA helicase